MKNERLLYDYSPPNSSAKAQNRKINDRRPLPCQIHALAAEADAILEHGEALRLHLGRIALLVDLLARLFRGCGEQRADALLRGAGGDLRRLQLKDHARQRHARTRLHQDVGASVAFLAV